MKESLSTQDILPMADQAPFGMASESREWYQQTFNNVIPDSDQGSMDSRLRGNDNNSKKAMVIVAHLDDESELAGGLIANLADKGYFVTIVGMTDGRKGGDARRPITDQQLVNLRLEESIEAANVLGVHRLINLGAIDGELPMDPASDPLLLQKLTKVMRQEGGSLYITHPNMFNPTTYDYHADHRHTANFVERAIQLARNGNHASSLGEPLNDVPTLLYMDPQNLQSAGKAAPVSFLLDITKVHRLKMDAFSQYKSQVKNIPDGFTKDYVVQRESQDRFRAQQMRAVVPYVLRRKRKVFAEGYGIHMAHGFATDVSGIFTRQEVVQPRRLFPRRRLPDFTR